MYSNGKFASVGDQSQAQNPGLLYLNTRTTFGLEFVVENDALNDESSLSAPTLSASLSILWTECSCLVSAVEGSTSGTRNRIEE